MKSISFVNGANILGRSLITGLAKSSQKIRLLDPRPFRPGVSKDGCKLTQIKSHRFTTCNLSLKTKISQLNLPKLRFTRNTLYKRIYKVAMLLFISIMTTTPSHLIKMICFTSLLK